MAPSSLNEEMTPLHTFIPPSSSLQRQKLCFHSEVGSVQAFEKFCVKVILLLAALFHALPFHQCLPPPFLSLDQETCILCVSYKSYVHQKSESDEGLALDLLAVLLETENIFFVI